MFLLPQLIVLGQAKIFFISLLILLLFAKIVLGLKENWRQLGQFLGLNLLIATTSLLWTNARTHYDHIPIPANPCTASAESRISTLSGKILSIARHRPGEIITVLGTTEGKVQISLPDLPWKELSHVRVGNSLRLQAKMKKTNTCTGKVSGYAAYLSQKGIVEFGEMTNFISLQKNLVSGVKQKLLTRLANDLEPSSGLDLIIAMTLGEKEHLHKSNKKLFQDTGLGHLLVVSGFHVGFVFILARTFFGFLVGRIEAILLILPKPLFASIGASFVSTAYVSLVGFSPAATRALTAILILSLGQVLGRSPCFWRNLLAAFICVHILWPGAVLKAGVQLSFAALIGLRCTHQLLERYEDKLFSTSLLNSPIKVLGFSCGAWLFTSPVVAYWFEKIVPLAPLYNALFSFPLSLLCVVIGGLALLAYACYLPKTEILLSISSTLVDILVSWIGKISNELNELGLGSISLSS